MSPNADTVDHIARLRERALANPKSAEAYYNLAQALGDGASREEVLANYQRALAIDPLYLRARLDLASYCRQTGDIASACRHLAETIHLLPQSAQAHRMLADVLCDLSRFDEAINHHKEAIRLQPSGSAYFSLGIALSRLGHIDDAAQAYRKAITLDSAIDGAHNNLGTILLDRKDHLSRAITCFQHAIRLQPNCIEYHRNLGIALAQAIRLRPNSDTLHRNLGISLIRQGRHDEAIHSFRVALRLQSNNPRNLLGLGNLLCESGLHAESLGYFHEALRLNPDCPETHNDLAVVLVGLNRLDEAIVHFNRTLELKPDHPTARFNRALALLTKGDFEQGWLDYDHRANARKPPPGRQFSESIWDGTPLSGRTIIIFHEQGFGDTIQFVRYIRFVKQSGGHVIFECPRLLMKLVSECAGIDRIVTPKEPLPQFDVYAHLMSLPLLLKHSLKTIPSDIPYLFPNKTLTQLWGHALRHIAGFKIAIVWQGNPGFKGDRHRSFPLRHFAALAKIPGVRLISVQQSKGTEQLASVRFPILDLGGGTFMDTAAILKNVDLVIAPDTAVAHLAGAIGARVWVLVRYAADWRWMLDRHDSPWYPTMRIFRQPRPNDWTSVFRDVAQILSTIVAPPQTSNDQDLAKIGESVIASHQAPRTAILRLVSQRLTKQGRVQEAVNCLLEAVQIEPNHADDHTALGLAYLQLNNAAAAVSHLERSLSLHPGQADVHCNLGVASFRLNRIREAALNYREALRLQPNHVDALHNMGNLQCSTGHLDPGIATLQAAVRLRPGAAASHLLLGKALAQKGDVEQAILAFRRVTELKPKWVDAHVGLGIALGETNRWDAAATALRRAIRLAPGHSEAHFQMGNSLRAMGRSEEA